MKYPIHKQRAMAIAAAMAFSTAVMADPVLTPDPATYPPKDFENPGTLDPISAWRVPDSSLSWADIHNVIPLGSGGDLQVDITGLTNTERSAANELVETDFADIIWQTCSGPYPFEFGEADFDYASYRHCKSNSGGIEVDRYVEEKYLASAYQDCDEPEGCGSIQAYNVNEWPEGQCRDPDDCPSMTIAYRMLTDDGFYDGRASFDADVNAEGNTMSNFAQITTITEGPFVNMVTSDDPSTALIAFETSDDCDGAVTVERLGTFTGADTTYAVDKDGADQNYYRHEIQITGLTPSRQYQYQASCTGGAGYVKSGQYAFRSAPSKGANRRTSFAFIADTRQGVKTMEAKSMGVNLTTASQIAADAYRRRADLFVIGGDLINGYSTKEWDFRAQLKAWKRAMGGFWRTRPIVAAIGNHEVLMDNYDYTQDDYDSWANYRFGIDMDKRPYDTSSASAVFADEFWHPENGPDPSDPERPSYKENVYSFQYGKILFIAANNNYWYTANQFVTQFGGSPEGYMMDDQLDWIEAELDRAQDDNTIQYIFLYFQEPVFPASTHLTDVMWWNGNNNIRAYEAYDSTPGDGNDENDAVRPTAGANLDGNNDGDGIIEVRNRLWTAVAQSTKVAAVLTGDEHVYHRTRIDNTARVGTMADDVNGDGHINWDGNTDRYIDWDGSDLTDQQKQDTTTEYPTPNPDFTCPTWHLTISGGGAPWYGQSYVPWYRKVEKFSSQFGYGMFRTTGRGISYTLYSLNGQVIDRVANLMSIKRECDL